MLYGKPEDNFDELISYNELVARHPNVTIPLFPNNEQLAPIGYVRIIPTSNGADLLHSEKMLKFRVVDDGNGNYTRVPYTEDVPPEEAERRRARKWLEIKERRNKLLKESDWVEAENYYYMKEEWLKYRQMLRDVTDSDLDPFQIKLPYGVRDYYESGTVDGQKRYLKALVKAKRNRMLDERPIIDTGLGYSVDGGYKDLQNFKMAKDIGSTVVWDADGNEHSASESDFDTIISLILERWKSVMQYKRDLDQRIDAALESELDDLRTEIKS